MKTVTIYTDGACSGNPGPGGWCAILRYGEIEKQLSGGEAKTTNNRMELTAVIEALRAHDKKISKADAAKRAMEMLEHLPEPGEVFEYDGFTVQVLEVDEQRVTRLRVTFDRSRSSMKAKDNDD